MKTDAQSNGKKSPRVSLQRARPVLGEREPTARSRITNGKQLLAHGNVGTWGRRYRDLVAIHVSDLGGPDSISASELAIVRRAATLMCECERMEERFAIDGQAEPWRLDLYQRASNSMRRLLESVGLQRRAKDVTRVPTVDEYAEIVRQEEQSATHRVWGGG
jgi:hypothetical protein